ncbi:MAG: DsbC family protein [Panacagrimonas sp.]
MRAHAFLFLIPVAGLLVSACAPPLPESGSAVTAVETHPPGEPTETAALPVAVDPGDLDAVKRAVAEHLPGVKVDAIRATPLPGVYELQAGMNFGYVSGDGRYLIEGDLNDLTTGAKLTEDRRRGARMALMSGVPDDQTIEFLPENKPAKYTVTVFTDVDCGYCRKLHQEMAGYNKAGIAVRYVFFPRSGPDTESFHTAEKVWCSADQRGAMTIAKQGGKLEGKTTCDNPVMSHYQLAGQLGIRGTPAIILPDGEMIPGYQPPAALEQILASHKATPPAG